MAARSLSATALGRDDADGAQQEQDDHEGVARRGGGGRQDVVLQDDLDAVRRLLPGPQLDRRAQHHAHQQGDGLVVPLLQHPGQQAREQRQAQHPACAEDGDDRQIACMQGLDQMGIEAQDQQ